MRPPDGFYAQRALKGLTKMPSPMACQRSLLYFQVARLWVQYGLLNDSCAAALLAIRDYQAFTDTTVAISPFIDEDSKLASQ